MKRTSILAIFVYMASAFSEAAISKTQSELKFTLKLTVMKMDRKVLSTLQYQAENQRCVLNGKKLELQECARINALIQKAEKSDLKSEAHPADDGVLYELGLQKKTLVLGKFLHEACEILPTGKLDCKKFPMNPAQALIHALIKISGSS